MSRTFPYKGYARIFVEKEEEIQAVRDLIRTIDQFEYDYLPDDLIAVWNSAEITDLVPLAYTHKFDHLDIDILTCLAWKRNIKLFIVVGGYNFMPLPDVDPVQYIANEVKKG